MSGKKISIVAIATLIIVGVAVALAYASSRNNESTGNPNTSTPTAQNSNNDDTTAEPEDNTNGAVTPIVITANGQRITANLNDSQVSKDFIATLPTTLPWFRNYGIEYITELKSPLTETGPFYTDVQPGDLVYYNPMDSITIIYKPTSSVPTLTKMGEITSDLSVFESLPENVDMRIELGSQ